jgi:hypothetical protein
MIDKIKLLIKQIKCKHYMVLNRWHLVHFPNYEPLSVEAEFKCNKCGKVDYLHLYDKEKEEWENCMGNYKKDIQILW